MEGRYGNYPARARVPRTTGDLHLTWDVPYEPGTLKAVGIKDGKVAATVEVSTAGEPAAIGLTVDREAIAADRRDVAHITVQIQDATGRMVPTAANEVAFELQGEGEDHRRSTTATRRATRATNRTAGKHSTGCAWPSCKRPANRARSE